MPKQEYLGVLRALVHGELSDLMGELSVRSRDYCEFKRLVRQCLGLSEEQLRLQLHKAKTQRNVCCIYGMLAEAFECVD